MFALANISDSPEYHNDIVRDGGLRVLASVSSCPDARVQRDCARALSTLSMAELIHKPIIDQGGLDALYTLARSLDIACQRYATLSLCNICSGEHKQRIVETGAVRPLLFLARFPDVEIQR